MSFLRMSMLLLLILVFAGCARHLSPDASLNPADLQGKSQAWFTENWGKPSARSKRFFGGEIWTYYPTAGGNVAPYECRMSLAFDKEGNLEASTASGC